MAGSIVITEPKFSDRYLRPVRKWVLAWTSDALGDVNGINTPPISGVLQRVVFNPGTPAPTALYDVVVNDTDGIDILAGGGADLSATASSESAVPRAVDEALELVVTNAGNATQGTVALYFTQTQ